MCLVVTFFVMGFILMVNSIYARDLGLLTASTKSPAVINLRAREQRACVM